MHNRTWTFGVFLISVLVAACSGGGSSAPPPVPTGSASGTVLDGLIMNGTVTAYDYSTGSKGAVLGQATTDSKTGMYSLSLQVESRPVLLEITGGYYNEEMDPSTNIPLDAGDKMQAVINYTTGAAVTTSITAMTTVAAGLAAYEIKHGTAVGPSIDDANHRISNLVGLDIIKTLPLEITDPANASSTLTPGLQYGFLAGGISMWASKNYPATEPSAFIKPYISIKFVQLMYQDIIADGLLDGHGFDSNGTAIQISFGNVPLSPTVYRQGLGVSMLQMADNTNNKTGLNSSKVLSYAQAFAGSTDAMFAGVTPQPITSPTVAITAPTQNGWITSAAAITATVQDYIGVSYNDLLVDGAVTPTFTSTTNPTSPSFVLGATPVSDGPHQFTVRATNTVGLQGSATVTANIDNTPPTIAMTTVAPQPSATVSQLTGCGISGQILDTGSGPAGQVVMQAVYPPTGASGSVTSTIVNGAYSATIPATVIGSSQFPSTLTITATDVAGNTTVHRGSIYSACTATAGCGGACTRCTNWVCTVN